VSDKSSSNEALAWEGGRNGAGVGERPLAIAHGCSMMMMQRDEKRMLPSPFFVSYLSRARVKQSSDHALRPRSSPRNSYFPLTSVEKSKKRE